MESLIEFIGEFPCFRLESNVDIGIRTHVNGVRLGITNQRLPKIKRRVSLVEQELLSVICDTCDTYFCLGSCCSF